VESRSRSRPPQEQIKARQVAASISSIDTMVRTTVEDLRGLRNILEDYQGIAAELAQMLNDPAARRGAQT
jgi:hypothetical protein